MTPAEFKTQIDRLTATYGPKAYPQERADLLWREFKGIGLPVFEKIVSRLIAEHSMAPMLPKFRELAAQYREQVVLHEKKEFKQSAHEALNGIGLGQFIARAIDSGNSKDLDGLVRLFGMEWVEKKYQQAKVAEGGAR
jgi:hypothetical protein